MTAFMHVGHVCPFPLPRPSHSYHPHTYHPAHTYHPPSLSLTRPFSPLPIFPPPVRQAHVVVAMSACVSDLFASSYGWSLINNPLNYWTQVSQLSAMQNPPCRHMPGTHAPGHEVCSPVKPLTAKHPASSSWMQNACAPMQPCLSISFFTKSSCEYAVWATRAGVVCVFTELTTISQLFIVVH